MNLPKSFLGVFNNCFVVQKLMFFLIVSSIYKIYHKPSIKQLKKLFLQ